VLQQAQIRLTEAKQTHIAKTTKEITETQLKMILIETDRNIAMTKEQANVDEAVSEQDLQLQEARRDRTGKMEAAKTVRENIKTEYEGKIKKANATMYQHILEANIAQRIMFETLEVLKINNTLKMFTEELTANVTAREMRKDGTIAAKKLISDLQPLVRRNQGLIDSLGLTPQQAIQAIWYAKLSNNTHAVRFGDYQKVPFLSEFGKDSPNTLVNVPLNG
jgi:hypothetical protein